MKIKDGKQMIWDRTSGEYIQAPKEILGFFNDIEKVCKKYNISISHEDGHGNFELERYSEEYMNWLKDANKGF